MKHTAVKILKLNFHGSSSCSLDRRGAIAGIAIRIAPLMRKFAYASCTLFGRDKVAYCFVPPMIMRHSVN